MGSSTKGLQALLPVLVPDIVVKACRPELASDEDLSPMRKTLRVPGLLSCVGVVAILDLSGYTALSELLFKGSDNAGGERLFKTVNPFFGAMIDTIRQYGGDIIKFCGDSIIIAWSQPSTEDVMDVTHAFIQNALLCVADMLQKYDGFKVELPDGEARGSDASLYNSAKVERKQDYKMGLHIGMGLGSFTHVFVGEKRKGRAEYLIIGKAIAEAACMLQKTKRGQIALTRRGWDAFLKRKSYTDEDVLGSENKPIIITRDSETMRLLQPLLSSVNGNATAATVSSPNIIIYRKVEEFMDDSTVLRLSSLAVDSVALDSLHTRLSELRRVTTVFLQIPDLSPQMEPSGALNLIQKLFEIVRVPLENYKGRLRQIVFDDKGLTFLLVWGLPPSNAMDHTLALFCALAIKDALLATSLAEFSIGVSSGPTFIGVIGNEIRSDFNLFGRSLNIAARCMALPMARKSVLCDLASIESKIIDAGGFEFSNPIEMKIKGVDNIKELALLRSGTKDPLRAGVGRFSQSDAQPHVDGKNETCKVEMVGRQNEMDAVEKVIHAWISQSSVPNPVTPEANQEPVPQVRPSGVMIFGKSGCGKTSMGKLCENLIISKTDAKRTIFCQMDCFEIARHAPFYVLKLLLSQVFDFLLLSKDILKESKQKVELFLKDDLQHRAFAKKGKVWRSASVHSVKTGISKLDSAMRLPRLPSIGSKDISSASRANSTKGSVHASEASSFAFMSGPEYLTSNDPSPYETNLRENDIIEVLEYIGISKKLTGTGIIDDIIGFLGVKNGNSDGFLNNPVGVRTIIVRILSVITKALGFKVVFMIDNCQWADMRSLTAIKNMFYANLNMMFLLLCRPLVEVNEPAILADLKAIVRMPSVLKVMLDTMDVAGTEAMILKYLGFRPHPSLTQEVFRNSGGIPMVIEILASGLKAHGQTRMMDDGSVKLADGVKLKAEDNDVGSLISAQFDSLSSKFQIILKVASVAGLNFSLSHVVQVCNDVLTARSMGSSISLEEAASIIETEDVHDFLQHPNGKSENGEDVCIAETYFFRHIYIHKGIKSMILMDLRKSIHFQLFLYLDMSVRKENSILQAFDISIPHNPNGTDDPFGYPLLEAFRHLEESGGMLETILHTVNEIRFPDIVAAAIRLDYLAGTAVYYCEKQIYGESLVVLDRLFSYWDEIPQLGNRLLMKDEDWKRPELFILTDQLMKANLMTMKSYLYRVCAEVQKSYDAQMMGFEYIGHPFPHSNSDCVKYLLKRINPIVRHTGEMRRFLRRVRKSKKCFTVVVDYSEESVSENIMNELLTYMAGNGFLVNRPLHAISACFEHYARSKNIFTRPMNMSRAAGYLYTDLTRMTFCGIHTSASISLLVFDYAEEYLSICGLAMDEFPNFASESTVERPDFLSGGGKPLRYGADGEACDTVVAGKKVKRKSYKDPRTTLPVVFDVVGVSPQPFKFDVLNFLFLVGYVARMRDLFELQEKYLRIACLIILELKAEGSLASVTTYAYYRELMHFFGRPKLAHLVLSRYTASNVDFRLFTPYYRSDACHYAVESLDLVNADRWERDYWRKTGLPGFYVSDNVDVESGNSGYSVPVPTYSDDRRRMTSFDGGRDPNAEFATARFLRSNTIQEKRDVERLPPFLERDAHMPFLLVRIAKIGVTVEAALKKCVMALQEERGDVGRTLALSDFVATCERLDRTLSVELEMLGKNLDELVKANAVVGPNMRYIALFRVMTAWQVWGLYGMARVKWFCEIVFGNGSRVPNEVGELKKRLERLDLFKAKLAMTCSRAWGKIAIALANSTRTYLTVVLRAMHGASIELGKGRSAKARAMWVETVEMITTLEDGKDVPFEGLVGEFREPPEWRGMRFFSYHRELLLQRVALLESLEFVDKMMKRRGKRGNGKVAPEGRVHGDLEKEWGACLKVLENVIVKLSGYGEFSKLDVMLVEAVKTFLNDAKVFS